MHAYTQGEVNSRSCAAFHCECINDCTELLQHDSSEGHWLKIKQLQCDIISSSSNISVLITMFYTWGLHIGVAEDAGLLGCKVVLLGGKVLMTLCLIPEDLHLQIFLSCHSKKYECGYNSRVCFS
jgi:hypothetical protein